MSRVLTKLLKILCDYNRKTTVTGIKVILKTFLLNLLFNLKTKQKQNNCKKDKNN